MTWQTGTLFGCERAEEARKRGLKAIRWGGSTVKVPMYWIPLTDLSLRGPYPAVPAPPCQRKRGSKNLKIYPCNRGV